MAAGSAMAKLGAFRQTLTSFFTLGTTRELSNLVMLEIPALLLVLASLVFIVPVRDMFSRRRLGFGILAAIAIWTKQVVFFLPFIYAGLGRDWKALRQTVFWMNICGPPHFRSNWLSSLDA